MYTKYLLGDSVAIQLDYWYGSGLGLSYSATGAKKLQVYFKQHPRAAVRERQLTMVNLVKFLRNKNLHEHQREKQLCRSAWQGSRLLNSLRQKILSPTGTQSFPKWNLSTKKNLKPVAVSFLLINSEITGRLEIKEGNGVTNSNRWNKSGTRQRRSKKRTEHLLNTLCATELCQN